MGYRQRATKPSLGLWMLIAIGDVALILASAGVVALIALASVVTIAVAAVGGWLLLRRATPDREPLPARVSVPMTARRRA